MTDRFTPRPPAKPAVPVYNRDMGDYPRILQAPGGRSRLVNNIAEHERALEDGFYNHTSEFPPGPEQAVLPEIPEGSFGCSQCALLRNQIEEERKQFDAAYGELLKQIEILRTDDQAHRNDEPAPGEVPLGAQARHVGVTEPLIHVPKKSEAKAAEKPKTKTARR